MSDDLLRDIEALRDEWESFRSDDATDVEQEMQETMLASAASRLTALLAKHAKATTWGVGMDKDAAFGKELRVYPAGPDLRAMVDALDGIALTCAENFVMATEPPVSSERDEGYRDGFSFAMMSCNEMIRAALATVKEGKK